MGRAKAKQQQRQGNPSNVEAARHLEPAEQRTFTVGEVATLANLTIRTLHHFDALGLLEPSLRSESGYRLYSRSDLLRLQQILLYRGVGMPLSRIGALLTDPTPDPQRALLEQRGVLQEALRKVQAMLEQLDKTLESFRGTTSMSESKLFEVFGEFKPEAYESEVQERWGETDAYRESKRRTQKYTRADWERYKQEAQKTTLALASLMERGVPPDAPEALAAVEQSRLLIDRWFYPCSRAMHAGLGQLYITDPRFEQNYEKIRPGLARFISEATAANALRGEPS